MLKSLFVTLAVLLGGFVVSGCEMLGFSESASSVLGNRIADSAEGLNEVEAMLRRKFVCGIGVGAMYRTYSPGEMEAIQLLCDPARRQEVAPEIVFVKEVAAPVAGGETVEVAP